MIRPGATKTNAKNTIHSRIQRAGAEQSQTPRHAHLGKQRHDLRLQLRLGLEHVAIAHRLVAACIGFDLGAIDGDRTELDQPHLTGQSHYLHEEFRELLEMQCTEVADGTMSREVAGSQYPEGDVFVEFASDLA